MTAPKPTKEFTTKDSGKRIDFSSGMRRDIQEGKPRFDLIPIPPLRRLADLYARGAEKYGDRNWQLANSEEECQRFLASAWRHFVNWAEGADTGEDEAAGAVWNIFAYETTKEKLDELRGEDAQA